MNKIKEKLECVLTWTIEEYIKTNAPVSSNQLIKSNPNITFSSAKLRYLMNELETMEYLKKAHSSSGRIPTPQGLSYYAKYIAKANEKALETRLKKEFLKKEDSFNVTVSQAVEAISDITGLTLITTKFDKSLILKGINLVVIDDTTATVVMVVSNGEAYSKIIKINPKEVQINDLKVAVRVFQEHLIGSSIDELVYKTNQLKMVLKQQINNYMQVIHQFVDKVFNTIKTKNNVYGKNQLILNKQITREEIDILLYQIENFSIWEQIEEKMDEQEQMKIEVSRTNSYISKRIQTNNGMTEISIIGNHNANFSEMKAAIALIEKIFRKEK